MLFISQNRFFIKSLVKLYVVDSWIFFELRNVIVHALGKVFQMSEAE